MDGNTFFSSLFHQNKRQFFLWCALRLEGHDVVSYIADYVYILLEPAKVPFSKGDSNQSSTSKMHPFAAI
jgi:hypothetical protein